MRFRARNGLTERFYRELVANLGFRILPHDGITIDLIEDS